MKKILTLIFGLTVSITFLFAQPNENQQVKKYNDISIGKKKKLAEKLIKEGSYFNAVEYLEDVYAKKQTYKTSWQLAELNRDLRDYQRAEKYYKKTIDLKPSKYEMAQFYLGQMLKMNGKYDEAKKAFGTFVNEYDGKDGAMKEWAKREIQGCDFALQSQANPGNEKSEFVKGDVNEPLTEYAPRVLDSKTMIYSTLRSDTAVNFDETKRIRYATEIYTATKGTDNTFSNAKEFSKVINGDGEMHVGNAAFSKDGNYIYFTKCKANDDLKMVCDIYYAEKNGSDWNEPKLLNVNLKGATTTQPAVGLDKDGNSVLYFSSNRAGGSGGMDLYYVGLNKDGQASGLPKNLGKSINTIGDEVTPFYDDAFNRLFFSSNGQKNIGGLDVMYITGNVDKWDTIVNPGFPLNSSADDIYLALGPDGESGYMVSNRVGTTSERGATCCDDILTATLRKQIFLRGYFAEKGDPDKKRLSGVQAAFAENEKGKYSILDEFKTGNQDFVMEINPATQYKMTGALEGYYPAVQELTTAEGKKVDTLFQVFYIEKILRKAIHIENIYFAFDKANIREAYDAKVDSIVNVLNNHEDWAVEVAGHTDSKGSDEYNEKLSMKRANEAAGYIENKGIDKDRIIVKGFGEKNPIAPNEFPDGRDNPVGRSKNRRVEFKIITDEATDIQIIYDDGAPISVD